MGKNTQEAEVIVTLNGQAAKKAIDEMTKEYERLTQAALDANKAGNDALGKELDTKAQKLMKDMEITRRETKKFADVMNNLNGSSLKDLRMAANQLKSEIKKLTPGTQEFIEKSKQLQEVNTRINQVTASFKGLVVEEEKAGASLKGLADGFNKYFGIASTAVATVTGISMAFRKSAEEAAKLDDIYADVMKTTGLLHDEVAALDKELLKIDTRTSREQLLLLARDAGKLGITGTENILGFVRAADQIQVALGEDLGEGAIRNLGKIADVLGYTKSMGIENALLSIGSAVNAVGQASTASESYLVEFTQRLAGVAAQANISAADIIGFASGLDQSAMKVEMAATAFQKFLMKMYEDPAKFAEYANMQVQEFSDLLKNDANTAIVTVLKSLKEMEGFGDLVPIFDDMGLDGARAVSVLASMASNLDAVTEAQALANVEFAKATSLTEEYNTKNNNAQAQLEKARKEFHNASIALGQSLNPIMLKSTKLLTYLIKLLATHGKEIRNAAIAVAAFTALVKADIIVEKTVITVKKVWNALTQTGTFLTNKAAAAYYKLTNQTLKYAAAQNAANAAASKSVYGLIALAIGTLVYKLTELVNKEKEHLEIAQETKSVESRINESYVEQKGQVEALTSIINNNNYSLNKRRDALMKLKEIVPNYHASLTEEGLLINNNTEALDNYLAKLKQTIRMKAYEDEFISIEKQKMELEEMIKSATFFKDLMIEINGGEEPPKTTRMLDYGFSFENLSAFQNIFTMPLGMKLDDWLGLSSEGLSAYGDILRQIDDFTEKMKRLEEEQNNLGKKIGITMKSEEDAMMSEIAEINMKYWKMEESAGAMEKLELERQRFAEIEKVRKKYKAITETETEENAILTKVQFDFLQERFDKLTKKEQAMVKAGYASLSAEDSKALKARYDKLMKADANAADKLYQEELKAILQHQRSEQNEINRQYFEREISTEQHEEELRRIKMESLQAQLALAKKYGKDTSQIEADILSGQSKNRKADYDKQLSLAQKAYIEQELALRQQLSDNEITQTQYNRRMLGIREEYLQKAQSLAEEKKQDGSGVQLADIQARQKEEENALKRSLTAQKITQEQYDAQILEVRIKYIQERLELAKQSGQDEKVILQELLDAQVEAEMLAFEQMEKLKKDAQGVKEGLSPKMARTREENDELTKLNTLHDAKLLSEEEYEQAVRELHKKYAQANFQEDLQRVEKYTQQVNTVMQGASDFVTALKESEAAKLEAQYQADLTAAGDNADKKAEIEAKYEEDKLELSKKYADTEMVINIAKTIAAGALAAIQAFAQLGPIAGGIMAGLIAATTAVEVATIIQQRNAIKNSSVSSSSSSGSSAATVRTPTGYSEGGHTDYALSDDTPVGIVHANEWVAPAWMVRENPAVFEDLEQYRKSGFKHKSIAKTGFADGGYTSTPSARSSTDVSEKNFYEAVKEGAKEGVKEALDGEYIKAVVVRRDISELDAQDARLKKQTSRG